MSRTLATAPPCPTPHTIEGQLDVACVQRSSPLVKAYDVGEVLKGCVHLHTEAPVLWAQQLMKQEAPPGQVEGSNYRMLKKFPTPRDPYDWDTFEN